MSYIKFVDNGWSASGKTKKWVITTVDGVTLGWVSWHVSWRKYTASFQTGTVFDHGCLREIATFVEAQTRLHKEA